MMTRDTSETMTTIGPKMKIEMSCGEFFTGSEVRDEMRKMDEWRDDIKNMLPDRYAVGPDGKRL
ncbi:hypothetical protein ACFQE1_02205 [Halobium palmae]|uniref:Uncharacterized protein n=1 Tax=Halobium palmae TaxID=1776492 RepID=A0ABD5RUY1_9EURY